MSTKTRINFNLINLCWQGWRQKARRFCVTSESLGHSGFNADH